MSKKYQDRDETNRSHFVNVRLSDDESRSWNTTALRLSQNIWIYRMKMHTMPKKMR